MMETTTTTTLSSSNFLKQLKEEDKNQEEKNSYTIDYLLSLKLPVVPEELKNILKVYWTGRNNSCAPSAVVALTDKTGEPRVSVALKFKSIFIKEDYSYRYINKELIPFIEMAQEEK